MAIDRMSKMRSAQAIVELMLGLFSLTLVLVALFALINYIVTSMNMSREVRAEAGRSAMTAPGFSESYSSSSKRDTVTVSPLAAEYIFGKTELEVREEVHIPNMRIQQ